MFARLGRWCHDRRLVVLAAWIVALVVLGSVSGAVGTDYRDEFTLPNVESKRGFDILDAEFGGQGAGASGSIVFRAEEGVRDPEVRREMEQYLAEIDELPGVRVVSPYSPDAQQQIAMAGPHAGRIAFATIELPSDTGFNEAEDISERIRDLEPDIEGVQIEVGGAILAEFEQPSSELLGLAFAIVILILAFGSVLAMGLPVGVALAGIGVGVVVTGLLSHVVAMAEFSNVVGVMIGLGVGIDYALFIVTRFRENHHAGHSMRDSVAIAVDTAGRAVVFAGATVVVSLLGMLIMGISFVSGLAIAAATIVAVTVVASLTLLPALVGFVGPRVETTRWRGLIAAALVAVALVGAALSLDPLLVAAPLAVVLLLAGFAFAPLRRTVPVRPRKPIRETAAFRWSRMVQAHPWTVVVASGTLLVVLALPVLGLRLGFADEGNYSEETSTRKAYDLLVEGFGPGFNGPFIVTSEVDGDVARADLARVQSALADAAGVAFASPPVPNDRRSPTAVLWRVIPTTSPQDRATTDLVHHLRDDVLAPIEDETGLTPLVTGFVPVQVDFSEYLSHRMPAFFAAVLGLSFLLLMVVFRSLLVPLKAVLMNLLSIGAAYGAVVALFQWGWLGDLTGLEPAPIEPFVPMMLFAVVFGLSMDYEVFLLSRIREEWLRTGDSKVSVADGLAATAKVITAAAAIMVFVFGSFVLENERPPRLMGMGLAMAVLLDATVVRMLLVPATMELLGDWNWWLPGWLRRILPTVNVEGDASHMEEELARELAVESSPARNP